MLSIVWILSLMGIMIWAELSWPKREILKKYSYWLLFKIRMPLYPNWMGTLKELEPGDLSLFIQYRKRVRVLYIVLFVYASVFATLRLLDYMG